MTGNLFMPLIKGKRADNNRQRLLLDAYGDVWGLAGAFIKQMFLLLVCCGILSVFSTFSGFSAVTASELADQFSEKFDALLPPPNSSVHSDYLLEQIALGSSYNVRILDQIYLQYSTLNEKYDALLEKQDAMIRQNEEIIEWLKKISQQPEMDNKQ